MLICPYCKNDIQKPSETGFCPVCNSYLGDIDFGSFYQNHIVRTAGLTDETRYYSDVSGEEMIGKNYINVLEKCYPINTVENIDFARDVENENKVFNFNLSYVNGPLEFFKNRMYTEALLSTALIIAITLIGKINIIAMCIFYFLYFLAHILLGDFLVYTNKKLLLKRLKANNKHIYQLTPKTIKLLEEKSTPNVAIEVLAFMLIGSFILSLATKSAIVIIQNL